MFTLELVLDKQQQLDQSSLVHLLRMCVPSPNSSSVEQARLGSSVAIKVWDSIIENNTTDIPLMPHVYAHFLQAIRPLPPQSKVREEYFDKCLAKAIYNQSVNVHILKEFIINASPRLYSKYFIKFKGTLGNKKGQEAAELLMQLVPASWSARANVDTRVR